MQTPVRGALAAASLYRGAADGSAPAAPPVRSGAAMGAPNRQSRRKPAHCFLRLAPALAPALGLAFDASDCLIGAMTWPERVRISGREKPRAAEMAFHSLPAGTASERSYCSMDVKGYGTSETFSLAAAWDGGGGWVG